jgi:peptide/nickel transport system permease protein
VTILEEAVIEETAVGPATVARPAGRGVLRRLRRDKFAVAGLLFLAVLVLVAIFADQLARYGGTQLATGPDFSGPSADHWLGTDHLGRDVASRLMFGSRVTIRVVLQVVGVALAIAVPIGLIAGYLGGRVDVALMRIMDAIMSVPTLILAMAFAAASDLSFNYALLGISIGLTPTLARLTRAETLAVREETFVEASKAAGTPTLRVVWARVLPGIASPLIVQSSIYMGGAILAEASLSILGVGVPTGEPAWGSMLSEAFENAQRGFWQMFYPGAAIALTVLAFNLVGDGLRDALGLDPGQRYGARTRMGLTLANRRAEVVDAVQARAEGVETAPILEVDGLTVQFETDDGPVAVVQDVTFDVQRGEVLGLVGESGSGKTVTSLSIMRLLPSPPASVSGGQIRYEGRDLLSLPFREMRKLRGREIAMVFQDPMASLNPAHTIGFQIAETVRMHEGADRRTARRRAVEMLDRVGISEPQRRVDDHPHQLSGGMRQRAMIALALACSPKLLLADEPTTALDVTVQAQILELLRELQGEFGLSVVFVTHDMGVVADLCDRVAVMYAGQIVEQAAADDLFGRTSHPYTEGLLESMPQLANSVSDLYAIPGRVPTPAEMPAGCRFGPRCQYAEDRCREPQAIPLYDHAGRSLTRCLRHDELWETA